MTEIQNPFEKVIPVKPITSMEEAEKLLRPTPDYEEYLESKLRLTPNLPPDNFIMKYIEYGKSQSDAYSEWHFAGAISLLSIIADRKLVLRLKQGDIYPNIWFLGLGDSTVSRKTTGMGQAENFIHSLGLNNKLPDSFTPERFIQDMNDNPSAFFWKDEAAGLFATLQKTYMSDMRDMFCTIYECKPYHRALRTSQRKDETTEFNIEKPYLTQWLLTTPDNFKGYATSLDITSGWLLRYLYLSPSYIKNWKPFQILDQSDLDERNVLVEILRKKQTIIKEKQKIINNQHPIPIIPDNIEIEMKPTPEAWEFFSNWQKVSEERIQQSEDTITSAIFGRLENYAIKLAMLFEFGKPDFNNIIELDTIKEACRLIDEYFLPTAKEIIQDLENHRKNNLIIRIRQILKKNKGSIRKTKLLQTLSLPVRQVEDALNTLKESEEIVYESLKNVMWIKLIKSKE